LDRVLKRIPSDLQFTLVTSRAVGKPEQWVPTLREHLADGARIALFQSTPEVAEIPGFRAGRVEPLPRGWLPTLLFHVER
jgi:hypothetical protein